MSVFCSAVSLLAACSRGEPSATIPTHSESTSPDAGTPVRGDWLVLWMLSDAESLNPLTSNEVGNSEVLGPIMSSLLGMNPENFEKIPVLATALPTISPDHLTYTFQLRADATFSDGKPVTVADVLFSAKAIKDPEVNAPFLRNYYDSLV